MREYLFRGKRIDNGEWVEGDLHKNKEFTKAHIHPIGERVKSTDVIPETVGQYTGLTDKNGKKIFEGDVVKYRNTEMEFEGVGEVCWNEVLSAWLIGEHVALYACTIRLYEVIGNIYDNPELLEGDN